MFEVESIGLGLKRSGYPKELQLLRPQLLGCPPVLLSVMRISPVVSFVRRVNSPLWLVATPGGPSPERSAQFWGVRCVGQLRYEVLSATPNESPFTGHCRCWSKRTIRATFVAGSIVVTSSTLSASLYFYPPMPQSKSNHLNCVDSRL